MPQEYPFTWLSVDIPAIYYLLVLQQYQVSNLVSNYKHL